MYGHNLVNRKPRMRPSRSPERRSVRPDMVGRKPEMTDRFTLPGDRRLAMSFVVNVEEGAEQSIAAGDKRPEPVDELGVALKAPVRNYGNESNYRYGITAGAPRVMRLLGQH